jgi:putative glycosyltransferase (TIGR04372 family)
MARLICKAIDFISGKIPVLIHTPRADSFGNCAEEIFFGLLKAKRENKKILFLHPHNLVFRGLLAKNKIKDSRFPQPTRTIYSRYLEWFIRNLVLRDFVANRKIFHIKSSQTVGNGFVWFVGGWLLTFGIALMWMGNIPPLRPLRKLRRFIWPIDPTRMVFDFLRMTPTIGRSTLWNPKGCSSFSWETVRDQAWKDQYDEYVPPGLMGGDQRRAEKLMTQMGIPPADWFVCLHVRESGYRRDDEDPRNASIHNYIEGIKAITAAGGWVVRLGDASMTPLPAMDRVIDYPHTRYKSELMDVYLVRHCRFYLGTNSGPSEVATLFWKPMVLVNVTEWSIGHPMKMGDLEIIKHVSAPSRDRFLSISELLDEPYHWQDFGPGSEPYNMVENTPDEIRDVVQEFLTQPRDCEYSDLQKKVNEGRKTQIRRWFDQPEPFAKPDVGNRFLRSYEVAARCDWARGTLGQKYLEQNWLTDNLKYSSIAAEFRQTNSM